MMKLNRKYLAFAVVLCAAVCTLSYAQETGSFLDSREGHEYKTVKIGDQWWIGENMAYKTDTDCWVYEGVDDNTGASYALYSAKAEFSRYGLEKGDGVSMRCLKD